MPLLPSLYCDDQQRTPTKYEIDQLVQSETMLDSPKDVSEIKGVSLINIATCVTARRLPDRHRTCSPQVQLGLAALVEKVRDLAPCIVLSDYRSVIDCCKFVVPPVPLSEPVSLL